MVDAVVGLAWVANRYAVKAWASRRLRLTRVTNAAQARVVLAVGSSKGAAFRVITYLRVVARSDCGGRCPWRLAGVNVADPAGARVDAVTLREALARRVAPVAVGDASRLPPTSLQGSLLDDWRATPGR